MKKLFLLSVLFLSFNLFAQKIEKENSLNISTENKKNIKIGNTKEAPIYLINEKVVSKTYFSKIEPDKIKSINVYKGDKAIELFGKAGKYGAISVILKSKKELKNRK